MKRCDDNTNICTHFDTMCAMHDDFSAMLLGLLPWPYNSYFSGITAALSVLGTKLSPDALMFLIINEFHCCTIKPCQSKDKGKDVAFHAESRSKTPWKGGKGSNKNIQCFNCHRKGHVKVDWWEKWGRKE